VDHLTTSDGAEIFYRDWGNGPPVVLSHGWPLNADSWESQMLLLAGHGYRVVAHDRRGHGRSTQTWHGNEMNTYADDLAALIDHLDLRDVALVGFSAGGGEVCRYVGRHGTDRLARVALVSSVTPFLLRTHDNPSGVPLEAFDRLRAASLTDRSQLYRELANGPFFGHDRPGANVSEGIRQRFWLQALQSGHRSAFECIAALSATDFRPDLAALDVPALVIHGEDDQIVPAEIGGRAAAALLSDVTLVTYPGAPHGLTETHAERLGEDLLAFVRS
jgi:non-heme chloroperoxidase